MRKFILFITIVGLLGISACSEFIFQEDENIPVLTKSDESQANTENVMLHEITGTYIVRRADPYRLDNFNNAIRNLRDGVSDQKLSGVHKAYLDGLKLDPTHYALKIYPRNETEQWAIERMEGISVSYLPFDCVRLPDEQQRTYKESGKSVIKLAEKSPYTVVYDDLMTNEGPAESVTIQMPVLYVVWPCDMPLPDEYDYVVDYEVFIPDYKGDTVTSLNSISDNEVMSLIEQKAIELALGGGKNKRSVDIPSPQRRPYAGHLTTSDDLLGIVPLPGFTVRFQLGSNIHEASVDGSGYFRIVALLQYESSFSLVLTDKFLYKITSEPNSTVPIEYTLGTVADKWLNGSEIRSEIKLQYNVGTPALEVLRATYFYLNGKHEITSWSYIDEFMRICASQYDKGNIMGEFYYNGPITYIVIYNSQRKDNLTIGTTLHELGHFVQYCECDGKSRFSELQSIVCESYASYVGWYLTNMYYKDLGYEKVFGKSDITGQARQWWIEGSDYSPIFVDLVDSYNQGDNSGCNNDPIEGFPYSIIQDMAGTCVDLDDVRAKLGEYINIYYYRLDYDTFIAPYSSY